MAISRTASGIAPLDDATDPVVEPEAHDASTDPVVYREVDDAPTDAPQPEGAHPESIGAADEEKGRRSFFAKIRRRAVVVPLACLAAFLIGFGSVSAVLRLTAEPAQPKTKPAPTTSPPAAAPAITTPPTSAAKTVTREPTPPPPEPAPEPAAAPAPQAGGSESPAPSPSSSPLPPPSSSPLPTTTTPNTTTSP